MIDAVINLSDVFLRYQVPTERIFSAKEFTIRWLQRRVEFRELWALRQVSLTVQRGEIVGVIGANGAGKSSLLKLIARVIKPTRGTVGVWGQVAPVLELGAGFDLELTGRENLYFYGAILGRSKSVMRARYERIMDFAELKAFEDAPLRTYSTGMVARLAFAVATDVDADLLLLDEVLAVGDEGFQAKCLERIEGFRRTGTTILLVTHNTDTVRKVCQRAIWLDHGRIRLDGDAQGTGTEYLASHHSLAVTQTGTKDAFDPKRSISRAEFADLLVKAFGLSPYHPDTPSYSDVLPYAWYYSPIETVRRAAWMRGNDTGDFRPEKLMTRIAAAIVFERICTQRGITLPTQRNVTLHDIQGTDSISRAISQVCCWGLLTANADGRFDRERPLTSAEARDALSQLAGVPITPELII